MNPLNQLKTITLPLLIAFALACFALLPSVQAAPDPPALGGENTRDGQGSLASRTNGVQNTAFGFNALLDLTTGDLNTALGLCSLVNCNGSWNTATGAFSLFNSTSGISNVATGFKALYNNNTGSRNVGVGFQALYTDVIGSDNTAIGYRAGSGITGSGNVCIGVAGVAGVSNQTRIRNVYGSVAGTRIVYVNSDNKIGTLASSRRYKEEIKPMDKASETLFALKPVTFRYKKEVDPASALSFGLIAEEVAEINPDLITRDEDGKPQTVRYEAVNAMLLNEFLKEHRTVQEQQKEIDALKVELKEQRAFIQNVSDKVELSRSAPQVAENNRRQSQQSRLGLGLRRSDGFQRANDLCCRGTTLTKALH